MMRKTFLALLLLAIIINLLAPVAGMPSRRHELTIAWTSAMDVLNDVAQRIKRVVNKLGNHMEVTFHKTGTYSRILSWAIADFKMMN